NGAMGPITFFNWVSTVWKKPFEMTFFLMGFRSSPLSNKPSWTSWKMVLDVLNSSHLRASPISETVLVPLHRADTFHCSPVRLILSGLFWRKARKVALAEGTTSLILFHCFWEDQFKMSCSIEIEIVLSDGTSSGSNEAFPAF